MIGDNLHDFDLGLCAHAVENVTQHMDHPRFAAQVEEILAARPLLLAYLKNAADPSLDAEEGRLLLDDSELNSLANAAEVGSHLLWQPYRELHRRYIETVQEVRGNLTSQAAEEWSEECAGFARELEADRVRLAEGIDIIRRWVRRLRTLLRVMGAVELLPAPEGGSLTPTYRTPAPPVLKSQSTNPASSLKPIASLPPTEPVPGLAAMLSQLTDAVNKIGAPGAAQLPPPEALSKQDAAKFLGVPVKTIEYLIRVRKIQYAQLGSQRGRVIPVEALRKLLQDKTQLTAQEELQRRGRR